MLLALSCLGLGLIAPIVTGCRERRGPEALDAATTDEALDLARAEALLAKANAGALPPRPDVLALARALEARAVREGAGARAVLLHASAARLMERVYRVEGREEDAADAVRMFQAAAKDLAAPGACEAALAEARLAGDAAHDGAITYAELYRLEQRLASQSHAEAQAPGNAREATETTDAGKTTRLAECAALASRARAPLEPLRPDPAVLAAIDDGLAGEGSVAGALDGGLARAAVPPRIVSVEEWPGEESARVVVVLDRAAHFRVGDEQGETGGQARTFVDLDGVDVGTAARGREDHDPPSPGVMTRVRAEATTTGARVALELSGRAYRRVFHLLEPYRIVIDIARHPPGAVATPARGAGARQVTRVVLDPGHGGSDPGAVGAGGVKEKDVTLDVAHKAAPVLARQGVQVLLTRDDDRRVSLEERTARANAYGADVFISIHCNAAPDRAHRGVETYVLDTSKDEMEGRIAARENATSQAATAELGSILASMRMADQATRSAKLADLLQRAAVASLRSAYPDVGDGGVHTAGFYVLVGARMPSALFETSYVSNAVDEERLGADDYKQRLADGIVNAVKAYREGR